MINERKKNNNKNKKKWRKMMMDKIVKIQMMKIMRIMSMIQLNYWILMYMDLLEMLPSLKFSREKSMNIFFLIMNK